MKVQVPNPNAAKPDPEKVALFPAFKDDMTPQDAANTILVFILASKGIVPEKYENCNFCFDMVEVEKMFDSCIRQFEERVILDDTKTQEKPYTPPEPRVDEQGKKHYSMDCATGKLGVDLQAIGSKN